MSDQNNLDIPSSDGVFPQPIIMSSDEDSQSSPIQLSSVTFPQPAAQPIGAIVQPSVNNQEGQITPLSSNQPGKIVLTDEKRNQLIQVFRKIPAIADAAKKLTEGNSYQALISPEVMKRLRNGTAKFGNRDDGTLSSHILDAKTGHIIGKASLVEVAPKILESINQLALQQSLADIVRRLEVIDEKLNDVLLGQQNDRLAEVKSGIYMYEQAVVASDPDVKRELLMIAIQNLNTGRNKIIASTNINFLGELPRNQISMLFSKKLNIPKFVESKAESVWRAAQAIIQASRYLVLAYSVLDQPDSLRVSLEQVESQVLAFQEKSGDILNWLSPTSELREGFTAISQGVLPSLKDLNEIPEKTIVLEFKPKEILP